MYSFRFLISLLVLSCVILSVGTSSLLSTIDTRDQIEEIFDAQMLQTVRLLDSIYTANSSIHDVKAFAANPVTVSTPTTDIESFREKATAMELAYEQKIAFQILTPQGQLLVMSDNSGHQPMTELVQGYALEDIEQQQWHIFRFYSQANDVWIVAAQKEEIRSELVEQIMGNTFIAPLIIIPIVLVIMLILTYFLMQPLKAFERNLNKRSPLDLTPLAMNPPKELQPVQHALNSYIQRIAQTIAREKKFSADAAHELKTPLAIIKLHQDGLADLLQETPESQIYLEAIDQGVSRINHTVEQLLILSRVDSIYALNAKQHPLLQVINNAINQLLPVIADYEWQIDITDDIQIETDAFYLELVFKNLIENACKYSKRDTKISIKANVDANDLIIQIKDQGKGMSTAQIAQATERFFRVDENHTFGAGLGLSICQHIIELHHGTLTLSPNTPRGLIVTLRLPKQHRM